MGKATREAYGEALRELGGQNENIVVLDADLSGSTKTAMFKKEYPTRFFNAGIAEQNMIGTAAGLAAAGKTAFASTFAVFATGRAFEQIRNSVCYPKLNVKVAATHAGLTVGEDGATHQAIEDVAIMRALPNMTVLVPADAAEAKAVVRWAAEYNGPVYIRLGRSGVPDVFDETYEFKFGKAVTLKEGKDVTLIGMGIMTSAALEAAEMLAEEGISATVLNMPTIKPIDEDAIVAAANATGAIVTCEEHNIIGGLGSAVAEVLAEKASARLVRVGVKDTFGESGKPADLLKKYGLTAADIVAAAKQAIANK
ncbi:MAG: transketolase family protein [Selenomonadales bacterium]|jgi:transketolase|nr:transketolase family protein [Selenomonadales bacterium]MBQ5587994.1 transketolase family protein [Selenomonadales bacterium]MBQ5746293.1 transketolase family protein [Selenomonadales bacterium]MBR0324874.1 transketolase family protein [Selenomonadales bacterium]